MTSDNVVELELVTAAGKRLVCNAHENADLFWACRGGGGGNFGVVTSWTFRTHPVGEVATFHVDWPWEQAATAVQAWQSFAPHAPDGLFSVFSFSHLAGSTPRVAAVGQLLVFVLTHSVALLADLIHNFGDALTAIPLGVAFFIRSARGERWAGLAVVLAIFISALVALGQTVERFIHPRNLSHLWLLAAAGVIGFIGNEIAAQVRLRAGRKLDSPALVADGNHARVDGFVSVGVIASAGVVAVGVPVADPIIGLVITLVILQITWKSWHTVRRSWR